MLISVEPIVVGGKNYYSIQQMASITNKSDQTIYGLISRGNAIRKMKHIRIVDRILIPCVELLQFPFTYAGSNPKENTYHYDKEGKVIV